MADQVALLSDKFQAAIKNLFSSLHRIQGVHQDELAGEQMGWSTGFRGSPRSFIDTLLFCMQALH